LASNSNDPTIRQAGDARSPRVARPGQAAHPQHTVHGDELAWLELMVTGAYPPAYAAPRDDGAAPTLFVPADVAAAAQAEGRLALLDAEGVTVAVVSVSATGTRDLTPDDGDRAAWVAGVPKAAKRISHLSHRELRRAPSAVRADRREGPVLALWEPEPSSRAVREAAARAAAARGATLLQLVGVPDGHETDRVGHRGVRLALAQDTRRPDDRLVVVPDPLVAPSAAGLLVRAHVAAGYGAGLLAVRADHWGALGTAAAEVTRSTERIGVQLVVLDVDPSQLAPSDTDLDRLLDTGAPPPAWFAEPDVARELARWHRPRHQQGFTVLLSGLSGSGKSTIARTLVGRLLDSEDRSVSLLDGDVVRHHLSKGLGFSRTDRDTNVRRIGFVASEITKAGGIAVAAPIAPYAVTRADVRTMVEQHGGFVLVHVATPLAECERRDRKGLYAKARAGEIPEFTGISDPYEEPTDAEVVVDTTDVSVDEAVDVVLQRLRDLGYVTT
jgi:sulfate adenylyltransferase